MPIRARHRLSGLAIIGICHHDPPTSLHRHFQSPAGLPFCVPPLLKRPRRSTGILTRYPSPTPRGLSLGADLPWVDNLAQEPLGFRRRGFTPLLSLLMPTCALPTSPPRLPVWLHSGGNAPLPFCGAEPAASVCCLSPGNFRRHTTRPVSCYAFFQGWLLLSQPPGCLGDLTTFSTEQQFWDLSGRSGLFPSRP